MRIAIDARELGGKPTGVGRYLAGVLAGWDALEDAGRHEYVLCAPEPPVVPPLTNIRVSSRNKHGRGTVWEQTVLPRLVREAGADVLFAPGYTGPLLSPVPMVLTVHDVSFAAHPEWFRWREGLRRRTLTKLAARRAARVLTVSEFSKQEILKHLGVSTEKVLVVHHGVARPESPATLSAPPGADHPPMVLYVGSIFERRHVPALVQGFLALARRRPDAQLEIVGDDRSNTRLDLTGLLEDSAGRVHIRQYVTDRELSALYARARAFAFLSSYEGFGMTPLEALAAGVPIVVLDTPVAREIYGAAAFYVPDPDPALVHAALDRALFDAAERARVLTAAIPILARYSWARCGAGVLEALEQAVSHR
jgi:glycosyltransferase involved in cell wall biosynthesis